MRVPRLFACSTIIVALILIAAPANAAPNNPKPDNPKPPAEHTVISNLSYAPAMPANSRGHLLDLYLPTRGNKQLRPLVIWTSGSAWLSDDGKAGAKDPAPHFTSRGWVVAGVSVRSSSQAVFPAQVHDIKSAIRWLRFHAGTYGIDPNRIAIMGDSSGGWATQMAAFTGGVRELEGNLGVTGVSSRVQAAVDFYGPTDFLQMDKHMLPGACEAFNRITGGTDCHNDVRSPESLLLGCAIQTCTEKAARANPANYVDARDPEVKIVHGRKDVLVPHHQSELLYAKLRASCATATFHSIPNIGHDLGVTTDAGKADGQQVVTTRKCRGDRPVKAPAPTWQELERFLRQAVR